jgi:hypothetical protein
MHETTMIKDIVKLGEYCASNHPVAIAVTGNVDLHASNLLVYMHKNSINTNMANEFYKVMTEEIDRSDMKFETFMLLSSIQCKQDIFFQWYQKASKESKWEDSPMFRDANIIEFSNMQNDIIADVVTPWIEENGPRAVFLDFFIDPLSREGQKLLEEFMTIRDEMNTSVIFSVHEPTAYEDTILALSAGTMKKGVDALVRTQKFWSW